MEAESKLYNDAYFAIRRDERRRIAYRLDVQKIRTRAPRARSLLDIGCGKGEFLEFWQDNYFGYDPFTFRNVLPSELFDVVMLRGTLQHIYNPVEILHEAKARLKPGGLLAILATPDTDSLGYLRWGTLPALDPCRNWLPIGHRALANLLRRVGFTKMEFQYPYSKPYARPLRNLWNFIFGKPDAFPGNMMECFAW